MMYFIQKRKKGFTLIELLVTIAIISLLSSVVLGSLNSARSKARNARRLSDLNTIRTALALYAEEHGGQFPSTGGIAWYGVHSPWGMSTTDWIPGLVSGGYISKLPCDPSDASNCTSADQNWWQSQYIYASNGTDYKLIVHDYVNDHGVWGPPSTGDTVEACTALAAKAAYMIDPGRTCWAYGIWTSGAASW